MPVRYQILLFINDTNTEFTQVLAVQSNNYKPYETYVYGIQRISNERFNEQKTYYQYDAKGSVVGQESSKKPDALLFKIRYNDFVPQGHFLALLRERNRTENLIMSSDITRKHMIIMGHSIYEQGTMIQKMDGLINGIHIEEKQISQNHKTDTPMSGITQVNTQTQVDTAWR